MSGTERASRSSFGTTRVSSARTAARAWSRPGRARLVPGESLFELDAVFCDAECSEDLGLGGEVLQNGRAARVADEFSHPQSVPFRSPSPDTFADHLSETSSRAAELRLGNLDAHLGGCPVEDPLTDTLWRPRGVLWSRF